MANKKKRFDVFISYSHKDSAWVRDTLVARLEQAGITVCIDDDTFDPGVPALTNMENAVAISRHTLLVLTPAWIKSEWTEFESLLSQYGDPAGKSRSILPLLLESCDVPRRIAIFTRLDFTGKADTDKEFAKLIDAIRGVKRMSGAKKAAKPKEVKPNVTRIKLKVPPPPAVGFIERHHADGSEILARLQQELAPEKNQLVVLWGYGGVGKSTLAAEATRQMSGLFAGRIVWTSANGRQDYSLSTLLDEIGVQLSGDDGLRKLALEPKMAAVQALIASLDGAALVVLDNFETIASTQQQLCAQWLMQQALCPALITTRERLDGGRNIPLDVMSAIEAHEYLGKLIAQTATPHTFQGIDRNRIIQAADANPLVMQWVIGQVELAQHPNDVLDDLAQGTSDAAERVFDRSFNLPQLGDDGRDALLALALFAPHASQAALAAVAGLGDDRRRARDAVRHLAALRLVETTEAGERLILRGLTRSLARARLSKEQRRDEFRRRFVSYFLSYAESHAQTTREDFEALEVEKDNVLGAVDEASGIQDWQSVMRLAIAAHSFLDLRGYWNEAIKCDHQAAAAARSVGNELDTAVFSHRVGIIQQSLGLYDEARQACEEALAIYRKWNSDVHVASALHMLAVLAQDQGEVEEARRLYTDSLDIKKRLGNQSGIASTLGQLGLLAEHEGNMAEAARLFREALNIFQKLKSPYADLARRLLERVHGKS